MRFGGVPFLGLHATYSGLGFPGFKEPSFGGFGYGEDDDAVCVPLPSPELSEVSLAPKNSPKAGRNYAHRSVFLSHARLQKRLRKTLYYGKHPKTDRPSLPMTGLLVNLFAGCGVQDSLERLNMDNCSTMSWDACISPHAVIMAMIYIERLSKNNPEFLYSIPSSHLFLVTTMVASKYLYDVQEDEGVYNDEWASSARMELEELNRLEIVFLHAMDWSLYVPEEEFEQTLLKVEKAIAFSEANSRGWFSATDLVTLGSQSDLLSKFYKQVVQQVVSMFFVALTTYVFAALTMTAAVIVGSEATASLANLMDSVSCPSTASAAAANQTPGYPATRTNDTSIGTIGVDLDFGALEEATSCEKSKHDFGTHTGRGWYDDSTLFVETRLGIGRSFDPGLSISSEDEALLRRLSDWKLVESGSRWKFSEQFDTITPLLVGLEKREIPQSTSVFLK